MCIDIYWLPLGFAVFYCIFMILDDDCDCTTRVIIKKVKRTNRFRRNKGEKK